MIFGEYGVAGEYWYFCFLDDSREYGKTGDSGESTDLDESDNLVESDNCCERNDYYESADSGNSVEYGDPVEYAESFYPGEYGNSDDSHGPYNSGEFKDSCDPDVLCGSGEPD